MRLFGKWTGRWAAAMTVTALVGLMPVTAHAADDPPVSPKIEGGENAPGGAGIAAMHVNGTYHCTATLIGARWVLTARHCLPRIEERVTVRVHSLARNSGGTLVEADGQYWLGGTDLGLLHLTQSVGGPYMPLLASFPSVGDFNYIYGWGVTCETCAPSVRLKRALVMVQNYDSEDAFGGRAIQSVWVTGGSCNHDSGGPQTVSIDGTTYQVGVLSTGDGGLCGVHNWYTAIRPYRSWIRDITGI